MHGIPMPNCTEEKIVVIAKLLHHVVPANEIDAKVEWLIQRQLSDAKNDYLERRMDIDR